MRVERRGASFCWGDMSRLTLMIRKAEAADTHAQAYPSSKKYLCDHHKETSAFALCAHCGKFLCRDCGFVIGTKYLCPDCLIADEQFNDMILNHKPVQEKGQSHAKNAIAIPEAPKTLRELPRALHEMLTKGPLFYKAALHTPFWISFVVAYFSLLPSTLLSVVLKLPNLAETNPEYAARLDPQTLEILQSANMPTLVLIGLFATAFQVLLLDVVYYFCIRAFSRIPLTWNQTSSTLHYCLTPLLFFTVAILADMHVIYIIALAVMGIKTTAATMITTQSSLLKGLLILFVFISFVVMLQAV